MDARSPKMASLRDNHPDPIFFMRLRVRHRRKRGCYKN
jgi:hypothetical protein